jgi:hypothetical protein
MSLITILKVVITMTIPCENVNFRFMTCFGEPACHMLKSAWLNHLARVTGLARLASI